MKMCSENPISANKFSYALHLYSVVSRNWTWTFLTTIPVNAQPSTDKTHLTHSPLFVGTLLDHYHHSHVTIRKNGGTEGVATFISKIILMS